VIRNVSGKFLADPQGRTEIDEVWANFTGGNMVESFVIRLGWIASNNSYSGKVYSVMPLGESVFDYEIYVEGRDSLDHRTTQSQTLEFDSYAGDLNVDDVTTGNSLPVPQAFFENEVGPKNQVSVNDVITIDFNASVADVNFGGEILQTWFKYEGGDYRLMNTDTAQFVAPSSAQSLTWRVKMMDSDSNIIEQSQDTVVVIQDAPNLKLSPDTDTVSINDSVAWVVTPTQAYGTIVQYEWDCDGSGADQGYVIGDSTETCVYATTGNYIVYSRVTDDDSNVVVDSSNIEVLQDAPNLKLSPDTDTV
jgi:hypothetical protein